MPEPTATNPIAIEITPAVVPAATAREQTNLRPTLPDDYRPFIDKYFLRSGEILKQEGINPFVRAQVVIRSSSGTIQGMDEALEILRKYSKLEEHGGRVYALEDGDAYEANKAIMVIEAPIQDIIELETMYLGVIAGATTKYNDHVERVDLAQVTERTRAIKDLIGDRAILYFGARHWSYDEDQAIARAAYLGGASACSTDVGAAVFGGKGVGTTPHIIENVFASIYGKDRAVVEATKAFDRVIEHSVPRVALVDYNNHEVDDSVATAIALEGHLAAVRIDTCGENVAQGACPTLAEIPADHEIAKVINQVPEEERGFWVGHGVTVSGVLAVRRALDAAGFETVAIVLSSGFASAKKVAAFVRAEKLLGVKLFETLGVGGLFKPCRSTKTDVVAVADSIGELNSHPISKVGRSYRPNEKLTLVLGSEK